MRLGGGSAVAAFVLGLAMSGFGSEAQADNHIQVSGCAGTEGTHYFAEDHLVYCSSAATDIGIDLKDATISLPTNFAGWHGVWGYHTGTGDINIKAESGSVTTLIDTASGIFGYHTGTGDISIKVQDGTFSTSGANAYNIYGLHHGAGGISINVRGSTLKTSGTNAYGITGWHAGTGDISIDVQDSILKTSSDGIYTLHQGTEGNIRIDAQNNTITTSGYEGHGISTWHQNAGDISIDAQNNTITTSGDRAYGILGRHQGTGDISINVRDSTFRTSGTDAYGIYGLHQGTGSVNVQMQGGSIHASGLDSYGIAVGSRAANGVVRGSVGFDAEGYRRQSVTVNGVVRGGSGKGAGVFLAGGGRVVVGPNGRLGAASGIAIRAAGLGPQGELGPLSVDFRLDGRSIRGAMGSGRIVNQDGSIRLMVNGVVVSDGAMGAARDWVPNGAWDVRARTAAKGDTRIEETYAPRAALYESLPGLLLRLDAGTPVRRPKEPAWARFEYGTGSDDPKHSQVGASYDFNRMDMTAGVSRNWGNGLGGSLWLRRVHGEMKADVPAGPGEMELHGVGAGIAAHWREVDGLEIFGELSLTDFDVDATSSRHGGLAEDAGADLWQARLAAEYRLEQAEGLALFPRVWAWHAKAEIDGFTDAVGARVSADESRTAVGLGLRAEMTQTESLLYGSLDVEGLIGGEETVTAVSLGQLASESERTRVLVGAGGRWQGQRVTLQGGLQLSDPGGKNQEISVSFSLGGNF